MQDELNHDGRSTLAEFEKALHYVSKTFLWQRFMCCGKHACVDPRRCRKRGSKDQVLPGTTCSVVDAHTKRRTMGIDVHTSPIMVVGTFRSYGHPCSSALLTIPCSRLCDHRILAYPGLKCSRTITQLTERDKHEIDFFHSKGQSHNCFDDLCTVSEA